MQYQHSKILLFTAIILFSIFTLACQKQGVGEKVKAEEIPQTPADEKILQARNLIEKMPDLARSHVLLAAAYLQKVRETGNYDLNREAEAALGRALELDPENFEARVLKAQIFLSEHEFHKALEIAELLEKEYPKNSVVAAAKTDALTELGEYEKAVQSAQKLVDLRPNAVSYTRVAHLRSLYGHIEGAIEARRAALKMADPMDAENLAWFHSELGREYFGAGRYAESEQMYDRALQIFPGYHWALAGKGKVRAAQGDLASAAEFLEKVRTPDVGREIYLADIYKKMGRKAEAEKLYREIAAREKSREDGDMHRIALLWADHDQNLDEALEVARKDREENADLLSSDTLAWCLYKKGHFTEARKYMKEAMRLKTKNALFYYHAGMIENALGNSKEAARFLKLSLETNPAFDLIQADKARETLASLE